MRRIARTFLALLLLGACQPTAQPETTPMADASATPTGAAVTAADTATAPANRAPTLPPTWTASPPAPEPTAANPAVTPTASAGRGTLLFVFNGDSIARLFPDGSAEELIHVGGAPADLAASPDGGLLAYTAQGSGSAREVFVISPDGRYTQQVSCLGYGRVLEPAWSPDGQTIAFAASQAADGPLGIYTANFVGSGQCPAGNNQRQIVQLDDNQLDSLVWDRSGAWLFFSHGAISAVNQADGRFYAGWIPATGYGPNRALAHHPAADTLVYLKANRDSRTGQVGGMMFAVRTGDIGDVVRELPGTPILARSLRYSRDGRFLLIAAERDIWVQDERSGSSLPLVQGGQFEPQPVFSPDAGVVAYVDGGRDRLTVPQVFVISRSGGAAAQLTFHQEGSITDLTWAASSDDG